MYTMGYSDHTREISEEVQAAHHVRYVVLPSGRKLYMPCPNENDTEAVAELNNMVSAANNT